MSQSHDFVVKKQMESLRVLEASVNELVSADEKVHQIQAHAIVLYSMRHTSYSIGPSCCLNYSFFSEGEKNTVLFRFISY